MGVLLLQYLHVNYETSSCDVNNKAKLGVLLLQCNEYMCKTAFIFVFCNKICHEINNDCCLKSVTELKFRVV